MGIETKITLIGSFRRDPVGLKKLYEKLSAEYTVLSPKSIDWDNPGEDFVIVNSDKSKTIHEIESRHLDAIRRSDFVVLFAPNGYVGVSGALEIGFAHALGIPVLSTESIRDQTLRTMVDSFNRKDKVSIEYGRGLKALQAQYKTIAKRSGWDKESAKDTMLLLTEELGELARAVRKHEGLKRDGAFRNHLNEEIADVQIYLAHLANTTDVDLGDAVTNKIQKNQQKKK